MYVCMYVCICDHTVLPATRHKWTCPIAYRRVLDLPTRDGWKAELTQVAENIPRWFICQRTVTDPSSNRARCRLHLLKKASVLASALRRHTEYTMLWGECVPSRTLRPSSTPRLIVPRTRTELAKRAFSVAAPAIWNSLPVNVVDANSLLSFKKHLKTHLWDCVRLKAFIVQEKATGAAVLFLSFRFR